MYTRGGMPFRPLSNLPPPPRWSQPYPGAYEPNISPVHTMDEADRPQPVMPLRPAPQPTTEPAEKPPMPPDVPLKSALKPRAPDSESDTAEPRKVPDDLDFVDAEDIDPEADLEDKEREGHHSLPILKMDEFEGAFAARAADGYVLVEDLPAVLLEALPDTSPERIKAAIQRCVVVVEDQQGKVSHDQALAAYNYLAQETPEEEAPARKERSMGCLGRWADQASDKKATNVLLMIVITVTSISAALAAGLAILFMWQASFNTLNQHMLEDLGTMKDIIDVFDQNIFVRELDSRVSDLSTLIATVTSLVSYKSVLDYNKKNLAYMATFMAQAVGAWYSYLPEKSYMEIAKVMGLWLEAAMNEEGRAAALLMVDDMLPTLPEGYELLVGEWTDATNTSVRFLTEFRYADQCVATGCGSDAGTNRFSPMKAAMSGIDGAVKGFDYRPREVLVGYTSIAGVGVEYKSDMDVVNAEKYTRVKDFFDAQNENALDSREFLLGRVDEAGNNVLLTKLLRCDESCAKHAVRPQGPLGQALQGLSGTLELIGYHGKPVVAAYTPIPGTTMGLVVQMLKEEAVEGILLDVARILDWINENVAEGTEELELSAMMLVNGTKQLRHLTKYRFPTECPASGCRNSTAYLEQAILNCSSGVIRTNDYRNQPVVASYFCVGEMGAYLSMKVDKAQADSEMLGYVIQFINERISKDGGTSDDFLVAKAKNGLTSDQVTDFSQFELLSQIKDPASCLTADCAWHSKTLLRAIQNKPGDLPANMNGVNYAGHEVTAAVDFDSTVGGGIGLVMQMNTAQFLAPILSTVLAIVYFTLGVTIGALIILVILTKWMMRAMIAASEEGKRAVEREKQQFGALVASMYPAYVVPRLLSGERQIVAQIKHTAVFFSDIYEFTSASNTISPEELVQFMGYTYGVMDDIAERYGVYKVKTVGDAYLGIAGLPGVGTAGSKDCCLDMMRFASCVAQVFSHRFNHPDKGKILTLVANTMSWNRRKKRVQIAAKAASNEHRSGGAKPSIAPSGITDGEHSAWTGKSGTDAESAVTGNSKAKSSSTAQTNSKGIPQVQCIMSYGISAGPVVAGVLQGKSPMFDIWGKTVNLASRMESTGQPGRIQVSENFFRKVAAIPGQPFTFEPGHKAYCKGFGAVNSYFVRSTSEPPPKDLLLQLGLEPRYGLFYFDNVLNGLQRGTNRLNTNIAGGGSAGAGQSNGEETRSEGSSKRSSTKGDPHLVQHGDDVLEYDDV